MLKKIAFAIAALSAVSIGFAATNNAGTTYNCQVTLTMPQSVGASTTDAIAFINSPSVKINASDEILYQGQKIGSYSCK